MQVEAVLAPVIALEKGKPGGFAGGKIVQVQFNCFGADKPRCICFVLHKGSFIVGGNTFPFLVTFSGVCPYNAVFLKVIQACIAGTA